MVQYYRCIGWSILCTLLMLPTDALFADSPVKKTSAAASSQDPYTTPPRRNPDRANRKLFYTPETRSLTPSPARSDYADDLPMFGLTFAEFLSSQNDQTYQRYKQNNNSKKAKAWRRQQREDYIIERLYELEHYPNLHQVCQSFKRNADVEALATDLHIRASHAYPQEDFPNTPFSTIGTHRHYFCERYMKAIKAYCVKFLQDSVKKTLWPALRIEVAYLNGEEVPVGTQGSVQPDIFVTSGRAFDHKFGGAHIARKDKKLWRQHVPGYTSSVAIHDEGY